MPLFIWKPSYETGINEIDLDHRQLFGIVNDLYEAMKQAQGYELMNRTVDRLLEYTQRHFATEESFMRVSNYPKRLTHENEHRTFCARIEAMNAGRRLGKQPPSSEMMKFLCEWLTTHVTTADKDLGRYLKRHLADEKIG